MMRAVSALSPDACDGRIASVPTSAEAARDIELRQVNKPVFFTLLPLSAIGSRIPVYPFQVAKTRLQAEALPGQTVYRGTWHALRSMYATEGMRSLYQGFGVQLTSAFWVPVYITGLEVARSTLRDALLPFSLSRRTRVAIEGLGAGAAATVTMQLFVVPMDVVSQHQMLERQGRGQAGTPWTAITKRILRKEGVRGLYRGFGVSVLTYFPASAIVWSSFAWLSDVLNNWLPDPAAANDIAGGAHAAKTVARDLAISGGAGTQVAALARRLMAGTIPLDSPCDDLGGIAGCMSAVATNGADVLRTRVQTTGVVANTSVRAAARALWREEGLAGFMRGVTARMLIAAPTTVLSMALYDAVKRVAFAAQKQQA